MKKKIAIFLALVSIFNTIIIPNAFESDALAGLTDRYKLWVRFNNKLTTGLTNSIPLLIADNNGTLTGSDALVEWDFATPDGTVDSGTFLLQYPIDDGRVAQFKVQKSVSTAIVTYDIYDANGAFYMSTAGSNKIYKDPASDTSGKGFYVHSQLGAASNQEHYVPYTQFQNIDLANDYYVYNWDPGYTKPAFSIKSGQGFSFKFENQTIHFLWHPQTNKFHFMASSFSQSTVYPVNLFLSKTPPTDPPTVDLQYDVPSNTNVLTGISANQITSDALSDGHDKSYVLNHTGTNTETPAKDPNLMRVKVNVPKVWNDTTGKFEYGLATQDPIQFMLRLTNGAVSIQVIVDNIFNPGNNSYISNDSAAFYDPAYNPSQPLTNNNGAPKRVSGAVPYIEFTLGKTAATGLPYGQLYEGNINFLTKSTAPATTGHYSFNTNKINYGKFYTFLRYYIAYIGEKYYAIIEPYQGYKGYYRLFVDNITSVTSYSDGNNPLYMPLALNAASVFKHLYKVHFSPGVAFESENSLIVESQVMEYESGTQSISIGIANNFEILEHKYIPFDELYRDPITGLLDPDRDVKGTLKLDLRWDIAREDTIKTIVDNSSNGKIIIKYDIYSTMEPYATLPDGSADPSKITTLDTISITITKKQRPDLSYYYEASYGSRNGLLAADTELPWVRAFTGDGSNANDSRVVYPSRDVIYRAYVKLDTLAFNKNAITNTSTDPATVDFYFPNIFFLNTKATEMTSYKNTVTPPATDVEVTDMLSVGESLYDSMTLDDFSKLQLPLPQNLSAFEPVTTVEKITVDPGGPNEAIVDVTREVSMKVKWLVPGEKIREYLDNTYPYDHEEVLFSLFISQTEAKLKPLPDIAKPEDRIKPPVVCVDFLDIYDTTDEALFFSDIDGKTAPKFDTDGNEASTITDPTVVTKVLRDYLRSGYVVCIKNTPISLEQAIIDSVMKGASRDTQYKIDGLDKNQKYYFSADMKIDYYTKTDPLEMNPVFPADFGGIVKTVYSMLTNIVSEVTLGDESKPSPEDKFPPAPVLSKDNIGLSSADILWDEITEPNSDVTKVKFEYEIIRTKDSEMDKALLDSKSDFKEIYDLIPNVNKIGLKTDEPDILEYNGTAFVAPAAGKYDYDSSMAKITLTDNTLSPNQLYFYYVRTVRIVNGKTLYSVWSNISVTSTPVKPPKNLTVLRGTQAITYNKEKQFLIRFDAPLTDLTKLGTEISIQYSIKKDDGEWSDPYTIEPADLKLSGRNAPSGEDGFTRFTYVVSYMMDGGKWVALKSGTTYTIKVRLLDLINNDASVYSNTDIARTEVNQDEYDSGVLEDQWLAFLKSELMKLIKQYYWYGMNSYSSTIVVYRPDLFEELLTQSEGSALGLVPSDSFETTYYLPASALMNANDAGKGFKMIIDELETLISPGAINLNYDDAFIKIQEKIRERDISDYYIKISFIKQTVSEYIDLDKALTDRVTISIDAVGSVNSTKAIDDYIFETLITRILDAAQSTRYLSNLKTMLADKDSNEELVKFINEIVEDVKEDIQDDVWDVLDANLKNTFAVNSLSAPLILRYANSEQGLLVKGYQYDNQLWLAKETLNSGGIHSISVLYPGAFIFAGGKPYFPSLDGIPGSSDIAGLIVKYGLEDFLGRDTSFKIDGTVSGYMLAGISARLMGAGKTADSYVFLKTKGYTFSTRTSTSPASKQEAIYLFMAVYEVRTNTKIATVRINNFAQTSGVKNMNDNYKQSIRVAYQLGIYSEKTMDAKSDITVRDLLKMLYQLKGKANL